MKKMYLLFAFFFVARISFAQWVEIPQKPDSAKNRFGAFVFSIGNKLYYGGGAWETTMSYGYPLKDFYEYDSQNKTWSKKGNIPIWNWYATSFSVDGKGYIGPGGAYEYSLTDSEFNQLWQYDSSNDSWIRKSNFPPKATGAIPASFVINHKVYVGADTNFYQYDPMTDKWTKKSNFPGTRGGYLSSFTTDNFGYFISWGIGEFWRYDPSKDLWEKKTPIPGNKRNSGTAFSISQKHRYLDLRDSSHIIDSQYVLKVGCAGFGTMNTTTLFSDMYIYNPVIDSWNLLSGFPGTPRGGAIATTIGDTIAYFGDGYDGQGGIGIGNLSNDWWSFIPPQVDTVLRNKSGTGSFVANSNIIKEIRCYPQPAESIVSLRGLSQNYSYSVSIFDALGKKLFSSTLSGNDPRINISKLSPGLYNLILQKESEYIPIQFIKD